MRGSRGFILLVIALFVIMVLAQMKMPKRFVWNTSFEHLDSQPYGCAVFDSLMAASVKAGYKVTDSTLYMLSQARQRERRTFLMVIHRFDDETGTGVRAIQSLLKRGDNVVLACGRVYSDKMLDVLGVSFTYSPRDASWYELSYYYGGDEQLDTITWLAGGGYGRRDYVFPIVWSDCALYSTRPCSNLVIDDYWYADYTEYGQDVKLEAHHDVLALSTNIGKGKLIITSLPHLFSNYGILDHDMHELGLRILSQAGNRPIVRIDESMYVSNDMAEGESQSPLRYLLANPPLRWALYLLLASVVCFFFFTARRRQRVIPVINPPANQSMQMVQHIGSLYYHWHDNADLMQKKYQYFTEQLRRQVMVDIDDDDHLDTEVGTLSQITGIPPDEMQKKVLQLHVALRAEKLSNQQLRYYINLMNDILNKL